MHAKSKILREIEGRIGTIIDKRYKVESLLGSGGVGCVYRVEHLGLHRHLALKVLHEEYGEHEEIRRRFEREAQLLSNLEHPRIVNVTDFGYSDGVAYLAMELLEGMSLADLLDYKTPEPDYAIEITMQVLEGVVFAHEKGVLHRDLKPGNVFLVENPNSTQSVKILDFGLAKMIDPGPDGKMDETLTKMGTVLGTPSYMSPEQAACAWTDVRTDIYSIGIMLYELLTARVPFEHENRIVVLRAHLLNKIPDPSLIRPGLKLSPQLDAVLKKALGKRREDRFSSAEAMLEALAQLPKPVATIDRTVENNPKRINGEFAPDDEATITITESMVELEGSVPKSRDAPLKPKVSHFEIAVLAFGSLVALALVLSVMFTIIESLTTVETSNLPPPNILEPPPSVRGVSKESSAKQLKRSQIKRVIVPATNPFQKIPLALQPYNQLVDRGIALSRNQMRELMSFQRRNPDDVRPSLLLAHDFVGRQWYSNALVRYTQAYEIDPSCRGTAWMLPDLIEMAETRSNGSEAADAIVKFYGPEAIGALDKALTREGLAPASRRRLKRVRGRLAQETR